MKPRTILADKGEIKILLLPFCLSRAEVDEINEICRMREFRPIVASSTSYALAKVREEVKSRESGSVRIVGVVCEGRAKKVGLGLILLKMRQTLKKIAGLKTRKIFLAKVPVEGGSRSMFGRRTCNVGKNRVSRQELLEALNGGGVFFEL